MTARPCRLCGQDYDPRFAGRDGVCDGCRDWLGRHLARSRGDTPTPYEFIGHADDGGDSA